MKTSIMVTDKHLQLFTFTGTRINRTIQLLLNIAEVANKLDDSKSSFDIEVPKKELLFKWNSLSLSFTDIDRHITKILQMNPALLDFSKWGVYLPENFQVKLLKDKYYDIEQTEKYFEVIKLVENK